MSMSPHYGASLQKLIDTVVIPFYRDLKESKDAAHTLTLLGRQGKITGIRRQRDDPYKE